MVTGDLNDAGDISTDPRVLDAIRMLQAACEAAARSHGEELRAMVVLWTTAAGDIVYDGGVTCSGPKADDQDLEIMSGFLDGIVQGDRESEIIPQMGAMQ